MLLPALQCLGLNVSQHLCRLSKLFQVPRFHLNSQQLLCGGKIRKKKGPIKQPLQKYSAAAISQSMVPSAISSIKPLTPLAESTPLPWKSKEHFKTSLKTCIITQRVSPLLRTGFLLASPFTPSLIACKKQHSE